MSSALDSYNVKTNYVSVKEVQSAIMERNPAKVRTLLQSGKFDVNTPVNDCSYGS